VREQALAIRVLGDELVKLGNHLRVATRGQVNLDAALKPLQTQLLQARRLVARARQVGELGQCRSAPLRQRVPQPFIGAGMPVGQRGVRFAQLALEASRVKLVVVEFEQVAGSARVQPGLGVAKRAA
jgi:hypothetical protein